MVREDPHPGPLPQAGEGESGSLSRSRERVGVRANATALRSSSTDAERLMWSKLRDRRFAGRKFRRQHPIGPFVADFACLEAHLVIELDGGQHFEPDAITADARRSTFLHLQGVTTLRLTNRDILAETESVLTSILLWLDAHHPHPSPLPNAGEGEERQT